MKLELVSKDSINIFKDYENILKLYSIGDNIGYICILNQEINKIFIHIREEYRSNGYGKKAFIETLKLFDEELIFETSNPIFLKILIGAGGINVGNYNGVSRIKISPLCVNK